MGNEECKLYFQPSGWELRLLNPHAMKILTEVIADNEAYLLPIGDIHLEDEYFTEKAEEKLRGYVKWIADRPNARVFITGDVFNVATRTSKTSPFSINKRMKDYDWDQMKYAVSIFEPIREQIIGMIDGNHEQRAIEFQNRSWLPELCGKLSTLKREIIYCKEACVLFLKVGKPQKKSIKGRSNVTYSGYIHHTCGGGSTPGGKINRVDKLRNIVAGCDFYIGGHNHMEGAVKNRIFIPNNNNCTLTEVRQMEVDAGGFLDYGGYTERYQLPPTDIGCPRLRLDGRRKDVHLSM